ncbi:MULTISPECIES: type II secretion system F family protein [Plesiomonas]|uniref:type II secretion system F family protein n=1 Tax=Plesiomonas sp. ZOR0011 TaxID=1339230 RepID=UPI0015A63F8B|nr:MULTISPECIES: type II secretion system F family protein [Plesiomonas]
MYRAIAALMKSGIPLHDILIDLISVYSDGKYKRSNSDNHKLKDPVAIIMERILSEMEEGTRSIGELFRPWIPEHEALILQAADKIGQEALPAVLDDLIYSIQVRKRIAKILLKAVLYPAILSFCGIGILMMYAIDVIPKLSLVSPPDSWPTSSHIFYSLSNFVNDYIFLISIGGISLYALFFVSLPMWTKRLAKLRIFADRYPPYSLYKILNGCSFMLSLSVMIKAGISMNDALGEIEKIATPWLKDRVQGAIYNVARGKGLGESLRLSGYEFPSKEAYHFISLLSKSSSGLSDAMYVFSKDWMEDSISLLEKMATIIFYSGIIGIGALIMLIILGQHGMTDGLTIRS